MISSKLHDASCILAAYSATVAACGKEGHWQKALALYGEAQIGPTADVVLYNATLSALEQASQWQRTFYMLDMIDADLSQLPGIAAQTESSRGRLQPDGVSFAAALKACERMLRWEDAEGLLERMKAESLEPGLSHLACVVSAAGRASDWSRALAWFKKAGKFCNDPGVVAMNSTLSALSHVSGWQQAVALLEEDRQH